MISHEIHSESKHTQKISYTKILEPHELIATKQKKSKFQIIKIVQ